MGGYDESPSLVYITFPGGFVVPEVLAVSVILMEAVPVIVSGIVVYLAVMLVAHRFSKRW